MNVLRAENNLHGHAVDRSDDAREVPRPARSQTPAADGGSDDEQSGNEPVTLYAPIYDPHTPPVARRAARKGVKRPRGYSEDDSDEEVPDLHNWLLRQGYEEKEMISLCRALASYLTASLKPLKRKQQD